MMLHEFFYDFYYFYYFARREIFARLCELVFAFLVCVIGTDWQTALVC